MKCLMHFLFFIFIVVALFSAKNAFAELSNVILRLDRLAPESTLSGMVCAKPLADAVENKVKIQFPADFELNSSGWSTNTSNIPSSSTAWPTISYNSILGNSVSFNSGNLAQNVLYCFNFTSTSTTGNTGAKTATISTLNSSNSVIESKEVGIYIANSDTVNVSGTVSASPSDFNSTLELLSPGNTFPHNSELAFSINYGSNLSSAANITVQASWSLGNIENSSSTVNLLEYVNGSATNAYNNTNPIIDTVNRTITWTINSFPPNTINRKVEFKLRTNSSYTQDKNVNFTVSAKVMGQGTETESSQVTKKYRYNYNNSMATSTPTSTKTTLTPSPSISPTQTFSFKKIEIASISNSSVLINTTTTTPARTTVIYGTSEKNLNNIVRNASFALSNSVSLTGLSRNTQYFYRIRATSTNGNVITSDIFTFKTAINSDKIPLIDKNSVVISSNNSILYTPRNTTPTPTMSETQESNKKETNENTSQPDAILPIEQPYEFSFSIPNSEKVKRITVSIKNENVLGITNSYDDINLAENDIEITEVAPGVYTGRLLTKKSPGVYKIFIKVEDYEGNISEQEIAQIKVVKPLTIYKKNSKYPLENARVTLYIYSLKDKLFEIVYPQVVPIKNPEYADVNGQIKYSLPAGKYKVEISAIGYKDKNVEFVLGSKPGEDYPEIYLTPEPFSIITHISYYLYTIHDVFNSTKTFITNLSVSVRFFDLITLISLLALVMVGIFSFSVRTHVAVYNIPIFFIFYIKEILGKNNEYFFGTVKDSTTGKFLSRVKVLLIEENSNSVLSTGYTNKLGEFILKYKKVTKCRILLSKDGYHELTINNFPGIALAAKAHYFEITKKGEELNLSKRKILLYGLENTLSFCFELVIFICIMFEIIFIQTIGVLETLPFIMVTFFTITIWLFYARRALRKRLPSY